MKKICISLLMTILTISQLGFINKTNLQGSPHLNAFENPNEVYCTSTRVDGVYKCSKEFFAFDTTNTLTVYMDENSTFTLENIFNDVESEIIYYDQLFDAYEAYDGIENVYTINESDGPVTIDQKLFDAIQYALENQDIQPDNNELLFNIALEPITSIWHDARYSEECVDNILYDNCPIPSEDILNQEYHTNPEDIILDETNLTIDFSKSDMGIDLGGFAKGYISMILQTYLSDYDISYILNLGASNVLVGGENISNPNASTYGIGLTEPSFTSLNTSAYGAALIDSSYSVVTSGSYQRYMKNINDPDDDTIYHHIIDPRTNYPGGHALAVSIITRETALSDILSTAIFLMDYDEGLDYVNSIDDLEAIWYFSEDDIRMSEQADDYIVLFNETEDQTNHTVYYMIGGSILFLSILGLGYYLYKKNQ
ncbi:FAD:protein FMN transferase [Mycoplasmatota bacterium]|nr:FAD:protein FMN transferase [Mycoplasmatota bacterium]